MMDREDDIGKILVDVYGMEQGRAAAGRLLTLIDRFPVRASGDEELFTEKDLVLITYADTLQEPGRSPLNTLDRFAAAWFNQIFSAIHILPFYPWSSDDGFSVVDFFSVDSKLGQWGDIRELGKHFSLMFDFVLNHVSSKSQWFLNYLNEVPGYRDLAIEVDPGTDLSAVTRPRTLPLLTPFKKASGRPVHVWTTFSEDQIDLNYKSLDVLERMVEVLLFYVRQGAKMIRMDAVAYLWKEVGTSCIHLPETHAMVKLFRKILDLVAPDTLIVAETNVPHAENIAYFGENGDEAQMVYNFTLPPLLFHAIVKQNAGALSAWGRGLHLPDRRNTFFNFTASHDGIGVRPLEGILPEAEIALLVDRVLENGGRISYRTNPDGSKSPYELNITYVDAMKVPGRDPLHANRFLASQAVALSLPGVPGVYIQSVLGTRNWIEGAAKTGMARSINRRKLPIEEIEQGLQNPQDIAAKIFYPYLEMIRLRGKQPAFHPNADFSVLELDHRVFGIRREGGGQVVLALVNLSDQQVAVSPSAGQGEQMIDLFSSHWIPAGGQMALAPYQYAWLQVCR
ncbi:MAG: alpha-glucosidase C-terminal domain-containing protein [Desulfobacterales bacterium]|nr:alpha-glucosidase C-terminal domain-containing protein [Desulfobacterales bacterium]